MPENNWWKQKEKASGFWLKLTVVLVCFLPRFLLNFIVKIVVFVFFIFAKNERKNIAEFRARLVNKFGKKSLAGTSVFSHFYQFGICICDKIAVWKNKITVDDLCIKNEELLLSGFNDLSRGKVIVVTHLGNIEISRAILAKFNKFKMVILVYTDHAIEFNNMINSICDAKVDVIEVSSLDVDTMSRLAELINSGYNVAIMGDRTPINSNKVQKHLFLGKEAKFNEGPYLLAGILKTGVSTLWCQKIDGKFILDYVPLCDEVVLSRNRSDSIRGIMAKFVEELEKRVLQTPTQWFNFYNFWDQ